MSGQEEEIERQVVSWGVGCLVATTALLGLVFVLFVVAFAIEPPVWVQVLLGLGLVVGGAALAWLVAAAMNEARARTPKPGPRPVENERPDEP